MCVTMIATLHSGKNKHLKRPIYIHLQGSFINRSAVHLSTHSIFFPSTWDYKVVGLCQESSRCSAEGVRAMCVRTRPNYVTLESSGWGWETERIWGGGVVKPRGRKCTERPRSSGRLTFYKTAVLSQVLVLSVSAALCCFFPLALVIIWSRGTGNRKG